MSISLVAQLVQRQWPDYVFLFFMPWVSQLGFDPATFWTEAEHGVSAPWGLSEEGYNLGPIGSKGIFLIMYLVA